MKNTVLLFCSMLLSISAFSQSEKYMQVMQQNIALLDSAKTKDDYQKLANKFELIANKEQTQWLPFYYAAHCNQMMCYTGLKGEEIDATCDKADAQLNKADSLQPKNSEIMVMKSRVTGARIMVNPMMRGAKYGSKSRELLQQAIALDSLNPRAYLTAGSALFYTPKMFGGGKEKAKTMLQKSADCYGKFQPASPLHPNWGKGFCFFLLSQCEEKK
jgi:hypothetical protein